MAHSTSQECSRPEISFNTSEPTPGQIISTTTLTQPNRRVSWDDYSLYYQNSNDMDNEEANKSADPSPKYGNQLKRESIDITAISPLSAGFRSSLSHNDSETDDQDSSASSMSPPPPNDRLHNFPQNMLNRRGSRNSRDDNYDDDDDDETVCKVQGFLLYHIANCNIYDTE